MAIVTQEMQKAKAALEEEFEVYQSPIVYSDAEAESVAGEIRRRGNRRGDRAPAHLGHAGAGAAHCAEHAAARGAFGEQAARQAPALW